jgi:curved DNA-binding protein CbpA
MITRNISGPSSWKLKRSHYATLELTPTASLKDIKNAFIQLSKQCHPDLLPEDHSKQDAERFQMVVEAYEVLSDPHRRKEYDATLGMSRKLPFRRPKTSNTQEYDEKGKNCRP